jgi:AcrR family transcriptional regulator
MLNEVPVSEARKYKSPLREAQAIETREKVLSATMRLLEANPYADFSMDEIARAAGVERRTVFRHFANKETLLDALWEFINTRLDAQARPTSLNELITAPKATFRAFDDNDGIIRSSLHTPAGRAMRMRSVPARRAAFSACLKEPLHSADPKEAKAVEALAHLLYSAGAWEILKDYAGLTGAEAGDVASWALETLVQHASMKKQS